MCKATIDLISPGGVPVTLEVEKDDDQRTIIEIWIAPRRSASTLAAAAGPSPIWNPWDPVPPS